MPYSPHLVKNSSPFSQLYGQFKDYFDLRKPSHKGTAPHWTKIEAEFTSQQNILDKCSLLSISDLKGNITYVNDKFCEVSKYTSKELIGKPHNIIRHPDTPASVFKELWSTIGSGQVWQGEVKNRDKNGDPYWVFATISPVMGENGKPIRYISVRQDITRQKLFELELIESRKMCDTDLLANVLYGSVIHHTFLSSDKTVKGAFPDSFLFYKAQNIVSGDFYYAKKNHKKSIAVVGDSTGHGVAASYVSIMMLSALTRLLQKTACCPDQIMSELHREILEGTCTNGKQGINESADMGICIIDHEQLTLDYVLAKMRAVIIRNGEVIELERERCSVGDQHVPKLQITTRKMSLQARDQLYIYTDGMIDQFGGSHGKKFTNKQLIALLQNNAQLSMDEQLEELTKTFAVWQDKQQQTDDMTLLGIRIT